MNQFPGDLKNRIALFKTFLIKIKSFKNQAQKIKIEGDTYGFFHDTRKTICQTHASKNMILLNFVEKSRSKNKKVHHFFLHVARRPK